MGADIVIAVHLERASMEANDIQSIFRVLEQSVRVVIAENEVRGLARADAVVSVPLGEYGSTDYQKSAPIMQKGYEAANDRSPLLAAFALDDANWQEYLRERAARKRTEAPVPQFINVQGTSENGATDAGRYPESFHDKPLDREQLGLVVTRLKGMW